MWLFDADNTKRYKSSMESVAYELACPITFELPRDPVMAEDGFIYERSAIEEHIKIRRKDKKWINSPATNEPMGPRLLSSVRVRNSIMMLVESGAIEMGLATWWGERVRKAIRIDDMLAETKKKPDPGGETHLLWIVFLMLLKMLVESTTNGTG